MPADAIDAVRQLPLWPIVLRGVKVLPREGAAIVEGPTTRGLAALPLRVVDDKLVVARPFVGRLGPCH